MAVVLCVLAAAGFAGAKTYQAPIPEPSDDTVVLQVMVAGTPYPYTWGEISAPESGRWTIGVVTQSYLTENPEQQTGIWLREILADVEDRSGVTFASDWRLRVKATDNYQCGLFVEDIKNPDNNYLVAQDPAMGCRIQDHTPSPVPSPSAMPTPAGDTTWYPSSYVRVCRNGDFGNMAYPARLVSPTDSMTVLMRCTAKLVVTSPTVSQTRANVAKKKQLALRAVATKADNSYTFDSEPVTWKSLKTAVATVNGSGTVTAKKAGTVVIRATSGKCRVDFTVKVVAKAVNAKKVTLPKTKSLDAGKTVRLTPKLTPSGTTSTISWKSSNTKVATVDRAGRVTGVKKGKVRITVRTNNGKTAVCTVTVR